MMSQPASACTIAWLLQDLDRLVIVRHSRRASRRHGRAMVNGSSATSHITPSSGTACFTARMARQTRFSGLRPRAPSASCARASPGKSRSPGCRAHAPRRPRRPGLGSTGGRRRASRERRARVLLVVHENRPDQVSRGQHVLGDQPARPVVAPVAPQSALRVGGERREKRRHGMMSCLCMRILSAAMSRREGAGSPNHRQRRCPKGPAPISSCGGVVVYSAPPSERRRRWKFGKR